MFLFPALEALDSNMLVAVKALNVSFKAISKH